MLPYVLISSLLFSWVRSDQCVLNDVGSHKAHKEELLKKISLLSGNKLVVESEGYSYALDVCHPVSKDLPKAAVTRSLGTNLKNTTTVLGRYNDTDIIGTDDWLILIYGSGDLVTDKAWCNGTNWKTMILMTCDEEVKDNDNLHLLEGKSNLCAAVFQLKISLLCPAKPWSAPSVFFTIFVVGMFLYFVMGILYRRFVLGAKGYEQVPNFTFWSSILALPREMLRKLLSGDGPRHDPVVNNQRSGQPLGPDSADEPLLSP